MLPAIRNCLAGGLALLTVPAFAEPGTAEDAGIRVAFRLTPTSITVVKGPFARKYGLRIEPVVFPTGIEINEAILTGTVDVGEIGIAPLATVLSRTSDIVAIGVSDVGGGRYKTVVRKESPYQRMDDLVGKKIAIKVGSGNYAAFLTYIGSRGWKESDFKIVNAGDQEAIAALSEGSVDAVIYWEPIASMLVAKGVARPIFSFKGVVDNPTFVVVQRKFATSRPDAVARYLAAFMDAQEFLTRDVAGAAAMITKAMGASGQQVDQNVIELSVPAVDYRIDLTEEVRKDLRETWKLLHDRGKLRGSEPDWSKALDGSYIEAARKLRAAQ